MKKRGVFNYVMTVSVALLAFAAGALAAEKYPTREIQLIIPNPAGGFIDTNVRVVKDILEKNLGVPVVINNRTGAGGATGTQYLVKSKPDGYTIGAVSSANTILGPATIPDIPFKASDLDALCKYANDSTIVFTQGNAPWKALEDFVADAKKHPGKYTYGATTNSVSHFLMQGFLRTAGITMTHVPLKGANETTVRVLGGNLDIGVSSITPVAGQLKAGTLKALFLATAERSVIFPQIPTLQEKGFRDPVVTLSTGFFAPRGLPAAIRQALVVALEKTIKDPVTRKKVEEMGAAVEYLPGDAFAKEIEESYQHILKFAKAAKPQK